MTIVSFKVTFAKAGYLASLGKRLNLGSPRSYIMKRQSLLLGRHFLVTKRPNMSLSPELKILGRYMAGEFDNQQQAIADPAWYVHLRLWQRPVPLFTEDSITFFAEQANIVNLDKPYRPRIIRIYKNDPHDCLQVQYYMLRDTEAIRGAGQRPEILKQLTPEQISFLPGCELTLKHQQITPTTYEFRAFSTTGTPCNFSYQGNNFQVSLGFEATSEEFRVYDKGIEPTTGKAIWGALMGPFRFKKRQDFAAELPV